MVSKLWDQTFLDYVIKDWEKSPVVDVKAFHSQIDPKCPQFYEPIAQVKFPGTKAACKCSLEISYEGECSQEQIDDKGCTSIAAIEPTKFDIVNDKYYCALRDNNYNFNRLRKPEQKDGKWSCNDNLFTKLCGEVVTESYEN